MQVQSTLSSAILDFIFALIILYSFALLGRRIRLSLPVVEWSSSVTVLWEIYLGLTGAAFMTTILGMLGYFTPIIFFGMLVAGPFLNLRNRDAFLAPWHALHDIVGSLRGQMFGGLALAATACITLVPTAAPEIFYDALYYHLGLPQQYVLAGTIQWYPDVVHSAFPAYLDVLFGLCLGLTGPGTAKFFNLLLFFLAWCATAAFVYEVIGEKRAAIAGAITVATIPGVVIMSTMCAIDSALIGFSAMSALAIARMRHTAANNLTGLALFAASTAGFVAGSKYTGLPLLVVLALSSMVGQSLRQTVRAVSVFLGVAMLIAAPWYVRNLLLIGDPVYPVIKGFLGDSNARWAMERLQRDVQVIGLRWSIPAELIIDLVRNPERFGAGAQTGILVPLGGMALLVGTLRSSLLRPWAVGLAIYLPIWMSMTGVMRYLYPIFPFCALGVAWATHLILERGRTIRVVLGILVLLAIFPLWQSVRILNSLYDVADVAALFSGKLSHDDYLTRRIAYYPATQWLNTHAPSNARVLYLGETRLLYLDRPVRFSSAYDITELARLLDPDAPPLFQQLRSQGITHILINGREIDRLRATYDYLPISPDAERRLKSALQDCRIVFRQSGVQICELPNAT